MVSNILRRKKDPEGECVEEVSRREKPCNQDDMVEDRVEDRVEIGLRK